MGLELLGLLGGAVTRLLSFWAEYKKQKQDNEHELALLDRQTALEEIKHKNKITEIGIQSDADIDVEWSKALSEALKPASSGVPFVDGLNALVRPFMTFWWCLVLYSVSKGFIIYASLQEAMDAKQMASLVLTDFDFAVVGSILGYWFVDRGLRKFTGK
jgi:hypothetical protein